jgi:hypothetical protein
MQFSLLVSSVACGVCDKDSLDRFPHLTLPTAVFYSMVSIVTEGRKKPNKNEIYNLMNGVTGAVAFVLTKPTLAPCVSLTYANVSKEFMPSRTRQLELALCKCEVCPSQQ